MTVDSLPGKAESGLEGMVLSGRYELQEEVGRGTWGVVHRARDRELDIKVAIKIPHPTERAKKEMERRGLKDNQEVIVKEALAGFDSYAHVIPNHYEFDPNFELVPGESGMPYLIMPFKGRFLSEIVQDSGNRKYLENGLQLEQIVKWLRGISRGAGELHRKGITHCDIKPDNIAIETVEDSFSDSLVYGDAKLADLGTKTFQSISWPGRKHAKGPRGNEYIRAPEAFGEDHRAKLSSDVFSIAAVAYRMFSGKYPLEDELDATDDPKKLIEELGQKGFDKLIKRKAKKDLKDVPRKLRKHILKNLSYHTYERNYDGESFAEGLEKAVQSDVSWKNLMRNARNVALYVIPAAALLAYASYKAETHEPTKLDMPRPQIQGLLYPDQKPSEQIEFVSETTEGLPSAPDALMLQDQEKLAKQATDNRIVAYLLKTHGQTQVMFGGLSSDIETDFQNRIFGQYVRNSGQSITAHPTTHMFIWSKAIEYALNASKLDGKVDLEDVMIISRIGSERVEEAKRISGSLDWHTYKHAKYTNGKNFGNNVIPYNEQRFVDQWLAYFHADI